MNDTIQATQSLQIYLVQVKQMLIAAREYASLAEADAEAAAIDTMLSEVEAFVPTVEPVGPPPEEEV